MWKSSCLKLIWAICMQSTVAACEPFNHEACYIIKALKRIYWEYKSLEN